MCVNVCICMYVCVCVCMLAGFLRFIIGGSFAVVGRVIADMESFFTSFLTPYIAS